MFWRKKKAEGKKKVRNYLLCPYCETIPEAKVGDCACHRPPRPVVYYRCLYCGLRGNTYRDAEEALDSWIRVVARARDAEDAIREWAERRGKQDELDWQDEEYR